MKPRKAAEFMPASQGDKKWLDEEVVVRKVWQECGDE